MNTGQGLGDIVRGSSGITFAHVSGQQAGTRPAAAARL